MGTGILFIITAILFILAIIAFDKKGKESDVRKHSADLLTNPGDNSIWNIEDELKKARDANKRWEMHFSYLCELKENGSKLEKAGDYEGAIEYYRQAVEYGNKKLNFADYASAIDRLVILYRKMKDYNSELDILNFALSHGIHPNHKTRYKQRLEKAKQLINKNIQL
jgi:tetratricopeptide (TPR) repeat protein